jgi:DNA-directed RNA polymerase specialized sigma24 family protein
MGVLGGFASSHFGRRLAPPRVGPMSQLTNSRLDQRPRWSPRVEKGAGMCKHSVLSEWELDALLAWLAPTREQAGEKYEVIRQTLTRYFEWRHCFPAEEHADEAIDRVARRLASGEQIRCTNPYRYFQGVARNICLELRKRTAHEAQLRWHIAVVPEHDCQRTVCLTRCLSALSTGARELLEGYYLDGRLELAAQLGITPNAVRLRVFKEKQKLKSCITRCVKLHEF